MTTVPAICNNSYCNRCSLVRPPKNKSSTLHYSRGVIQISEFPSRGRHNQFQSQEVCRLRSLSTKRYYLLDVVVRSSVDPAGHFPSGSSPGSWKMWIVGMVISLVLPFWKSKWGPLLKLKNEVETVIEVAEELTEVVEKVAEGVEKVAEEVAEILPEGGKVRDAVECVEHVAKEIDKDAHLVEGLIDKVEELEKEVESSVESLIEPDTNRPAAVADVVAKETDESAPSV